MRRVFRVGPILVLLALLLGTAVLLFRFVPFDPLLTRTADSPALLRQVQELKELVTVKYSIQKVVGFKEQKVPIGAESMLLVVQARVLGGIDLSRLSENDFIVDGRSVLILLPAPEIMHVYLDEKNTKVWDRRITWWTPWVPFNPDLERQARMAAIEDVRKEALNMGILEEARRNAEGTIRGLLQRLGFETVRFKPVS
ncbi:MAG: DUF4230 domain-containing protein [Bryobacteraceae bacterium]